MCAARALIAGSHIFFKTILADFGAWFWVAGRGLRTFFAHKKRQMNGGEEKGVAVPQHRQSDCKMSSSVLGKGLRKGKVQDVGKYVLSLIHI